MGSTKSYDTLIELAKNKKLKSNAEPGQEDSEFQQEVDTEIESYKAQADAIYDAERGVLKANFKANKALADANKPLKEAQAELDRFNSTDVEKYGEDNIKTTVQKELQKLMEGIEGYTEKLEQDLLKKKEQSDIQEQEIKQVEQNRKEQKSEQQRENKKQKQEAREAAKKANGIPSQDIIQKASELGKSADKDIDELADQYNKSLKEYEDLVYGQAIQNGETKGAKLVGKYNKTIKDTAKNIFDKNKDKLAKAQIAVEQVKQTAILKLGALFGL